MSQHNSDPSRADDTYALPDVETFYRTVADNKADGWIDDDGDPLPAGWYWWTCYPGCMPDSAPFGPFDTEAEAVADAQNF